MLAEIIIDQLKVETIIGVNPEERVKKQPIIISLSFHTDIKNAAKTDELKDSVDYDQLSKNIISMVETSSFNLIEALAEEVALLVLTDQRIKTVSLFIYKPLAIKNANRVGIKLVKHQQEKMVENSKKQSSNQLTWD